MWGKCGEINEKTLVEITLRGFSVPGAGIEPARIAPLVFETSASTDSAIRASALLSSSPLRTADQFTDMHLCYWHTKSAWGSGLKESA